MIVYDGGRKERKGRSAEGRGKKKLSPLCFWTLRGTQQGSCFAALYTHQSFKGSIANDHIGPFAHPRIYSIESKKGRKKLLDIERCFFLYFVDAWRKREIEKRAGNTRRWVNGFLIRLSFSFCFLAISRRGIIGPSYIYDDI